MATIKQPQQETRVSPPAEKREALVLLPATGKALEEINAVRALRNLPPLTPEQTTYVNP